MYRPCTLIMLYKFNKSFFTKRKKNSKFLTLFYVKSKGIFPNKNLKEMIKEKFLFSEHYKTKKQVVRFSTLFFFSQKERKVDKTIPPDTHFL